MRKNKKNKKNVDKEKHCILLRKVFINRFECLCVPRKRFQKRMYCEIEEQKICERLFDFCRQTFQSRNIKKDFCVEQCFSIFLKTYHSINSLSQVIF